MSRPQRFPDPNTPPPGETAVTYRLGLTASGGYVDVAFGTGHDQVMRGDTEVGGSAATPADALLDASNPNTVVVLDDDGVGESIGGDTFRNRFGAATVPTYGPTSGRPAASQWIAGQVYHDTDANLDYACITTDAGVWTWKLLTDATHIRGVAFDATSPTDGQLARYDSASGKWKAWSPPWAKTIASGTTTTDDTTTTCGATYTPATGAHVVELLVAAYNSDKSATCAWRLTFIAWSNGSAATVGDYAVVGPTAIATTWTVAVDTSGNTVRLRVTGAAATNLDWTARWVVYDA